MDQNLKDIKDNNLEAEIGLNQATLVLRAQKLTVAVYKITQYISDQEPIKWQLRDVANQVLLNLASVNARSYLLYQNTPKANFLISGLCHLCEVAKSAGGFSQMNFSILKDEYLLLKSQLEGEFETITGFKKNEFVPKIPETSENLRLEPFPQGHLKDKNSSLALGPDKGYGNKGQGRKEAIIKLLRRRGESEIKDINKALPEIGEKTIQRDLRELVETGKIKRLGQRRWSRYSLV